ncbi:insulin-like growth factor 2 mRNA-binding protein 2 isoform X2 [Oculina patagonica]
MMGRFPYIGEDELPDLRNSQSPDGGKDRRNGSRTGKPRSGRNRQPRDSDYFIRILVPPTMVGAIIGKEGKKIKDLTEKTETDITVHKKDDKSPFEKVVEIVGTADQCTAANLSIHRTMRSETDPAKRSPVVQMRVLVDSCIAGQVIGKGHGNLKQITETTDSSVRALRGDLYYGGGSREEPINQLDRVITIQYQLPPEQLTLDENTMLSSLEESALLNCSNAEQLLSAKAYDCLKKIMREPPQRPNPQHPYMQPHAHHGQWPPMGAPPYNNPQPNNPFVPYWFQGIFGNMSQGYMHLQQMQVKVHLSFPSKFAGPLIGKKASNLAHIKKFSGARNIHVFPKDRDAPERYIEIIGTPLQQYFAQHCVYCKLAEEGYKTNSGENVGELKLKTEIFVPLRGGSKSQPNIIGRFIGKDGQNVKELQKQTGVRIKVETKDDHTDNPNANEAVIVIEESFASGQRAQMQIHDAIVRCQSPPQRR